MDLRTLRRRVRPILSGLSYQLAHAVRSIEHDHMPDIRQFECRPGIVTLAVGQGLIEGRLRKFGEADVCLLRHLLERSGQLDLLQISADWMQSHFGLGECPVGFGNDTGRIMRRSAKACLALVNGCLNTFANWLNREVRNPLSVGWNESVKPYSGRNAIADAFECA
jgi:hypothetical protein